jgi:hypothetical protein
MYPQVRGKKCCQLRFISLGYCDWIYHKGQNTLLCEVSRLLRCLHRCQERAAVGENTILPMSKKDEC